MLNQKQGAGAGDKPVFECGPKLKCKDGEKHDYSKWEQSGDTGTAVCAKCGHRAIDDAYWF